MTLSTEFIFLTDEKTGFKLGRETRSAGSTTVLMCTEGFIDVYYRGEMLRIEKDHIFVRVPNATELGPYEMSEDFQFKMISIPVTLFEELMYEQMRVEPRWWQKLEYLKEHPIFHLEPRSIEFCHMYFQMLEFQLQDNPTDYRLQIMKLVARAATMELLNYMDKKVVFEDNNDRLSVNTSDYTFRSFTRLLREYPHKREVQWYAKELNITPKYLSEICKERSGKSASQWIADVTIAELKQYLLTTTLPIREIASAMEFPNASFFCQYTKKHTGLTPNHFRKQKAN
jgi:YesN/AraC family two-component response regulator